MTAFADFVLDLYEDGIIEGFDFDPIHRTGKLIPVWGKETEMSERLKEFAEEEGFPFHNETQKEKMN